MSIDITLLLICHAIFSWDEDGVFNWDNCLFVSGSYIVNQLPSLVTTLERKYWQFLMCFWSYMVTSSQCCFWLSGRSPGMNFAAVHLMLSLSNRMCWQVLYDIPTVLQMSWIICLWFLRIISHFFSFFVLCWLKVIQNIHYHQVTFSHF